MLVPKTAVGVPRSGANGVSEASRAGPRALAPLQAIDDQRKNNLVFKQLYAGHLGRRLSPA